MKGVVVGLPFSGKTTLMRVLTGTDRSPAIAHLVDRQLEALARVVQARRITGYALELVDFDGFGKAFREDWVGQMLAELVGYDLVVHVVGAFAGHGTIDDLMDRLLLADLERVERQLPRIEKEVRSHHAPSHRLEAFSKARQALEEGRPLRTVTFSDLEHRELLGYGFVTLLPHVIIWNRGEEGPPPPSLDLPVVETILPLEEELKELDRGEAQALRQAYGILPLPQSFLEAVLKATNRIRFYTGNEKDARMWLIPKGAPAVEAARAIHTDLARTFVRADVIPVEQFITLPEVERTKHFRRVGKDWKMEDGLYVIVYASSSKR